METSYQDTSPVKGVHWVKSKNKWSVEIRKNMKNKYLGAYDDLFEAIITRYAAEQCIDEKYYSNSTAKRYVKNWLKGIKGRRKK